MLGMRITIEALKEAGLRDQVVVMVGDEPLTPSFPDGIGADLHAPDASAAGRKAREALWRRQAGAQWPFATHMAILSEG
jgi:methanogenic corrinoid protein MtbC1